jgi:hypothetical protein
MQHRNELILFLLAIGGIIIYSRANAMADNSAALPDNTSGQPDNLTLDTITNEVLNVTTGLTRGERNNNPGNLEGGGAWQGLSGSDGPYLVFSSAFYGLRALAIDLGSKFHKGLVTVRAIISVYAPPQDNPNGLTAAYISAVSRELGVGPDTVLNLDNPQARAAFVTAIVRHENGRVMYAQGDIQAAVDNAMGLA